MSYVTVFNTTDGPVVADSAGRVLAGQDWGAVDTTHDATKQALDDGRLVRVDLPDEHPASKRRDELNGRAKRLASHEVDQLREAAVQAAEQMPTGDPADLSKPQLVAALTAADVDLPPPTKPGKTPTSHTNEEA